MGVYITIEGSFPCPTCDKLLTDWQCKNLDYDGYPIAIVMQHYTLNKKMQGEMYNTCKTCGLVELKFRNGQVVKQ